MAGCALLIRFDARTGREDEVEALLRSIQPPAGSVGSPRSWFSLRMAPEVYGLFATFEEESHRQVFLEGLLPDWNARSSELLSRPPVSEKVAIVAQSTLLPGAPAVAVSPLVGGSPGGEIAFSGAKEIPKVGSRDAPGG
jgi:hypothetical protein